MSEPKDTGPIRNPDGTFPPGVSGNPKGKPPGSISIVAILKRKLEECPPDTDKKTYAEFIVEAMMKNALKENDRRSLRDIIEYVDGMPKQTVGLDVDEMVTEISVKIVKDGTETPGD